MKVKLIPATVHLQPDLMEFAEKELVRDYSFFGLEDCLSALLEHTIREHRDHYEERGIAHAGRRPPPLVDPADIPEGEIPW